MNKHISFKTKRGITITEVIVAMLIIVVVSAVSIGMVSGYTNSSDRMMGMNNAASLCSNVREMFMYADSEEEFEELLSVVADIEISNSENPNVYVFNEEAYSGYFLVSYTEGEKGVITARFSALLNDMNNRTFLETNEITRTIVLPEKQEEEK